MIIAETEVLKRPLEPTSAAHLPFDMEAKTVLISGAGIAGPALAFWLRRAGLTPTVIERSPRLRTGGYVIDFWGLGYDIAEAMGLKDEIERIGYHVRELRVVDDGGRRVADFGTRVFEQLTAGRYVTLPRSALSCLIFNRIKNHTEFIFGDDISALSEEADGVHVRFREGPERRFDLLIGADGLHSMVRRLAFGGQDEFEKPLGYSVAAFESDAYRPRDEDVYIMHGKPGRMLGRFTLRDNRTLFLLVFLDKEGLVPLSLDAQKALLRRRFGADGWETNHILSNLDRTQELYFDRVSQIRMSRWSRGHIALVGDAAFCPSLLAGQGSALAMISAYVLAGELLSAGGRHQEAFTRYEAILRDYITKKQQAAESFATAFAPRTHWGLWFRNLVINGFSVPGVSRLALGSSIVDRLRLPAYNWPSGDSCALN
ncbi:FAD-binding domain [Bradyrhizobium sp. USDA 10063]